MTGLHRRHRLGLEGDFAAKAASGAFHKFFPAVGSRSVWLRRSQIAGMPLLERLTGFVIEARRPNRELIAALLRNRGSGVSAHATIGHLCQSVSTAREAQRYCVPTFAVPGHRQE